MSDQSEILNPAGVELKLGDETVKLEYTLASLHYLTTKHPDLPAFLKTASGEGKVGLELMTPEFIGAVADFVYAGLYKPDDTGNDVSGWSTFRVMRNIKPTEIGTISKAVALAFNGGAPKVEGGQVDP